MPQPELEQLVESHRTALHTYVSYRLDRELRRREPVSDIVQSALREVLANPGRFTYQGPEALRAFLIRAVEHKIANKRRYWDTLKRSGRNHQALEDTGLLSPSDSRAETPSQVVEQREALESLAAALDELSEEDRRMLTMRRFAGLSAEAIGAELGLSASTVRYHLGRIMALLSQRLAEHGQG